MSMNRNKIDPISFACLISKVAAIRGEELHNNMVKDFHDLVLESVIEPPLPTPNAVSAAQLDSFMAAIKNGWQIEAIKIYRSMVVCDLKAAKDAVQAHWPVGIEPKPYPSEMLAR